MLTWKRNAWLLLIGFVLSAVPAWSAEEPQHDAVKPVPREGRWLERQDAINARAKEGNVDLLFLGDSITQGWNNNDVWKKFYGERHAMNAGIGGDRTQHVLWRLDHGNIDGIQPKLVVLMIGTNNSRDNSAAEITDGVTAIVKKLREKLPETKILLLAVFPRGETPNPQREKLTEVNSAIAKLDDGKMVHYLDIGPKFLSDDGTLSKDIMPDFLHLSLKGYEIWAQSIESKVAELLGDKPIE